MRIGVVLRTTDQHGVASVYTQRLLSALLQLQSGTNSSSLSESALVGTYAGFPEVEETALAARTTPELGPDRRDPRHPAASDRRVIQPEVPIPRELLALGLGLSRPRLR